MRIDNNMRWTHWYMLIPGLCITKCIILEIHDYGWRKFFKHTHKILTDENEIIWVSKEELIERN